MDWRFIIDLRRLQRLGHGHRLLNELDGAAFQNAGCQVSQMVTKMHHDSAFWFSSSGSNDYDEMIVPATRRRIIGIHGSADQLIPYHGGSGVGTTHATEARQIMADFLLQ